MLRLLAETAFMGYCPGARIMWSHGKDLRNIAVFQCGVHAAYVRLNRKWGAKVFKTATQRDENYNLQNNLEEHGLAPLLGEKFSAVTPGGTRIYGFITEHVIIVNNLNVDERERLRRRVDDVIRQAQDLGINDLHDNNIGLNSEGIIVVLDVSCNAFNYDEFYQLEDVT